MALTSGLLLAVSLIVGLTVDLARGVPLRVAVLLPLSVKDKPAGRLKALKAAAGKPLVVTVKKPAWPTTTVVVIATQVITGFWSTVKVKSGVALGATPLQAVRVKSEVRSLPLLRLQAGQDHQGIGYLPIPLVRAGGALTWAAEP